MASGDQSPLSSLGADCCNETARSEDVYYASEIVGEHALPMGFRVDPQIVGLLMLHSRTLLLNFANTGHVGGARVLARDVSRLPSLHPRPQVVTAYPSRRKALANQRRYGHRPSRSG